MVQLDRAGPATRRLSIRKQAGTGALLLLLAAGASAAHATNNANPWTGGQPATLSSYTLFSVVGDTVTITEPASPVTITVNGYTNTLLGLSGIWIVDTNGNAIAGVTDTATGGYVYNPGAPSGPANPVYWDNLPVSVASNDPAGYHDPSTGAGYGAGDAWLQLASNSLVSTGSGKAGTGYTVGSFTFPGLSSLPSFTLGVDYLQANGSNGNTGRAFFATPFVPSPVPEPGAVATALAMGGTTLLGVLRGRRPRRRSS